jgi:DNA-binding transcriptional LysR family regulator
MTTAWLDLELRHLATLRVLAEERSFRGTARRLGFAQSAISRHISTLEHRVGAKLVLRGSANRQIEMTDAGRLLLKHADAILGVVSVAEREFVDRAGHHAHAVRVATFQSASARLLAPAIAQAQKRDPGLGVDLVDLADATKQLLAGEVDLAFSETTPTDERVSHVELLQDPYVLASANGSDRETTVVSIEDIARLPLMTLATSCHLEEVERELAERGIYLRLALRSDDALTLQSLAASGAGIALLPRLAVNATRDLHLDEVDSAIRPRTICLAWNKQRALSERVSNFVAAIRAASTRLAARPAA